MAPGQPTAATGDRLLEAAVRVLETEGPEALQARRMAGEIGASTMAVYTHFGGMPGLIDAVVRDGLTRFAAHVRTVPDTDDPMADLIRGGIAFSEFAMQNRQLYRLIFGLANVRASPPGTGTPWSLPEGADAFSVLLRSVERVIAAGRIRPQDPTAAATQVLSTTHGFILLVISGFVADSGQAFRDVMVPLTVNLMVGLGDDREAAERSLAAALR